MFQFESASAIRNQPEVVRVSPSSIMIARSVLDKIGGSDSIDRIDLRLEIDAKNMALRYTLPESQDDDSVYAYSVVGTKGNSYLHGSLPVRFKELGMARGDYLPVPDVPGVFQHALYIGRNGFQPGNEVLFPARERGGERKRFKALGIIADFEVIGENTFARIKPDAEYYSRMPAGEPEYITIEASLLKPVEEKVNE